MVKVLVSSLVQNLDLFYHFLSLYNIDIDLNGTNVTADDIMRKFKSELALINAKEGRVRSFGGNY